MISECILPISHSLQSLPKFSGRSASYCTSSPSTTLSEPYYTRPQDPLPQPGLFSPPESFIHIIYDDAAAFFHWSKLSTHPPSTHQFPGSISMSWTSLASFLATIYPISFTIVFCIATSALSFSAKFLISESSRQNCCVHFNVCGE